MTYEIIFFQNFEATRYQPELFLYPQLMEQLQNITSEMAMEYKHGK